MSILLQRICSGHLACGAWIFEWMISRVLKSRLASVKVTIVVCNMPPRVLSCLWRFCLHFSWYFLFYLRSTREGSTKAQYPMNAASSTFSPVIRSISSQPAHLLSPPRTKLRLTVGFLETRARTVTTKLLGLAPSVIGDKECPVVLDEGLLQLVL